MLPALFTAVAPPGARHVWLIVGAIAFGITVIASLAAWSARETSRVHLNDLGRANAQPVGKPEYDLLRAEALSHDRIAREPVPGSVGS